jgi:flagellar motor protein MotB
MNGSSWQRSTGEEESSYLASVSDLMVGLLFVFLIILMAFALKYRSEEQRLSMVGGMLEEARKEAASAGAAASQEQQRLATEIENLEAERSRLMGQLEAERDELDDLAENLAQRDATRTGMLQRVRDLLAERQIAVSLEPENGVLRMPEELLFESGAAELRDQGTYALRQLAYALARSLPCYARAPEVTQLDCPDDASPILEAVLIEGHSDNQPIASSGFGDNWSLASLRGINTYKALISSEPSLDLLQNARGEALLGVSAYEARRPVLREDTPDARRRNRRIDLRFIVAAPSGSELEWMRGRIGGQVR